ncbi:hypothetical protein KFL_002260070 [Klebsormidium nitens]|uniref:Calponin-homology (CH) domain-containing protein n=1 Tax=Klebsormidium nitens TaxID=105231 RepID=A0A1Y1I7X9_KLENI|nr:hypothetical protein KFL_002260070 [Klebsormidium nitens]|eukprot:GAQ85251.1 hypothetical protein KFL_002260070 [Klebsormidium nitens]
MVGMTELSEAELQNLYTWVDEIPLSRPKRNIARDFSDGVLAAEIVAHYFPKTVETHNYSQANGFAQKMYNWNTLNLKVFKKLQFSVTREEIEAISNCVPGAIEKLLKQLKVKIAKYKPGRRPSSSEGPAPGTEGMASQSGHQRRGDSLSPNSKALSYGGANGTATDPTRRFQDLEAVAEKDAKILELRETNELLDSKVKKLEQLVRLKESKIQALTAKLQQAGLA